MAADAILYEDEDHDLMVKISHGDHDAYNILVRRHIDKFYGLAWRMTSDVNDAEDIVQDAFLKIWKKPDLFDPSRGVKFTTWFYRIVVNVSHDYSRKNKKSVATDKLDALPFEGKSQSVALVDKEQQTQLERAILALPLKQKTALNLCVYEECSNREAADIMGIGVKALESLLVRAKKAIKSQLQQEGVLS